MMAVRAPPVLSSFNDYELRHLVSHLAGCDRHEDLHALLTLDAAPDSAENAWFAAKEAIGDGQGYLDDIQQAARVAADGTAAEIHAGHAAAEVGLEIRYTLIRASLTTLAVNLPASSSCSWSSSSKKVGSKLCEMRGAGRGSVMQFAMPAQHESYGWDAYNAGPACIAAPLLRGVCRRTRLSQLSGAFSDQLLMAPLEHSKDHAGP
jgi:hypothetical protein